MMDSIAEAMSLGWQHQQAGNLDQAEALYRQVLNAEPQDANGLYRLAVVCQLQGRAAEAILLYQQLLTIKADFAKVHNNLGLAYASQDRPAEALAHYQQALRLKPDFAETFNNLGNLQTSLGNWDQARSAYDEALALKPAYPAAWNNLGRAHLHQKRWDEAVRCFQEALALQPHNAIVLNQLGNALFEQGKLEEAGGHFREAVRVQPDHAEAHYNVARVCRLQQRWEEAVVWLQQSLRYNANSALAYGALGDIYYCHLAKYPEALRCYQQVLALSPNDAKARLLVEALGGESRLARVPNDYVTAVYEPLANNFDEMVERRGDRSPEWLKSALGSAPAPASLVVLDLGCGTGLCGLQFRAWAKTLIGVDLSANMLAKARARGIYDKLILSDLLPALQDREGIFDLIVASDVLLYVGDLGPVFKAVQRALRPGGRFAFTVDLVEGTDFHLTRWIHFAHSRRYLQRLTVETSMHELCTQQVVFPREAGHQAVGLVVVLARSQDEIFSTLP